ncbi:MAG TPA: hypothetical protein VFA77_03660 [Candidatus Eisenbacteria bacterium]|nr:hypothetical protein [Candidatus Eisenbacteria bacterium]
MSDFAFSCPLCHQSIQCDEQYRGHQLQCPLCHGEITAPPAPARSPGPVAVKVPVGEKHVPNIPMLQPKAVVEKKGGAGKVFKPVAAVVLVLVILFFMAKVTGLDSHFPPFLRFGKTESPEETAAGAASAQPAAAAAANPAAEAAAAKPAAPPPPPTPVVWTTNLANAVIPTNAAYGKISAVDFKYDSARVDNGILLLQQGKDPAPDLLLGVLLGLKAGDNLSGKTYNVSPEARVAPRVWKKWKPEGKPQPQQKVFSKGYAMKLEFGSVTEQSTVPGKIFLCLPDEEQTVVAGSFVAIVGATIAAQSTIQPTTPTPASSAASQMMRQRYGQRGPTPGPSRP